MKKFLFILALVATVAFAQTPVDSVSKDVRSAEGAFSKGFLSIEAGEVYPWGDLLDAVEDTYYIGLGFRYTYWNDVDGILMFNYSYFKPVPLDVAVDGAHQFSGKLGLDWHLSFLRPLIVGGGFTCNWSRADLDDGVNKKDVYEERGGTLTDNETEFGWFARINIPLWKFEKVRVGFNILWEELWTLPERSDMLTAGIYVERRMW